MFLVAGLAVAGLAGIAAAFYLSVRPGSSRARASSQGRAGADELPASRSRTSPPSSARSGRSPSPGRSTGPSRSASPPGPAAGRTGPDRRADVNGPTGPRPAPSARAHTPTVPAPPLAAGDMNGTPAKPRPGVRSAPRSSHATHTTHATHATHTTAHATHGSHSVHTNHTAHATHATHADDADHGADADQTPKSRRRVGWRKAAEVDQELWPAEAFGGVTDEQFWDDLAADKPLATTARTAQPDSGSRKRPQNAVPQNAIAAPDRGPKGSGAYPRSRPDSAERTAIQPVQAAAQPSSAAVRSAPSAARAHQVATQPSAIVTQPVQAVYQPTESRGRPRPGSGGFSGSGVGLDDDPLTSPAYSLRPKGAVDGRSYQPSRRSDGYRPDPLQPGGSWSGPTGSPACAEAIATQSYRAVRGPADVGGGAPIFSSGAYPELPHLESIQTMSTPPYGEMCGYGGPAGPVGDSKRPNGTWGYGQPGGHGKHGNRNAYLPGNSYWGPYDLGGNGSRLGSQRFLQHTGFMPEGDVVWYTAVRRGRPCRRCGTPVRPEGQQDRVTFWCQSCQPG
jgi:hypothetical protein